MSTEFWGILGAVVLTLIAGYLVAVEQAWARVSQARVQEYRQTLPDDSRRARRVSKLSHMIEDRPRYVNCVVAARLAAETFAVVTVTFWCLIAMDLAPWISGVIAGVIMLAISFIGWGVAPRTLGQQRSLRIAVRSVHLVRLLRLLLGPLSTAMVAIGNALTPGTGYREGPFATETELREIVNQAEAADIIEDDERQMIQSVIDLGDTHAREVMVPRTDMVWIEATKTVRQALSLSSRSGFSRIPVVGEDLDDVVGVVYLKDIVKVELLGNSGMGNTSVGELMRQVYRVPESKRVDDVLREMQAERSHFVIVVDEYGGTAGLVTIEDIVEEIVGEIADEHDQGEIPDAVVIADGSWRVNSRMQLDDLAELTGLGVSEDDEDVDTVGGLLAHRLGVVPIPGSQIEIDGYELVAELGQGRRNRVATVLVTAPTEAQARDLGNLEPDDQSVTAASEESELDD